MRIKANLKNLPAHLRTFLPMFKEMLPSIGTKNYSYDIFNNRMMGCSSGLQVDVDRYSSTDDYTNILDRNE